MESVAINNLVARSRRIPLQVKGSVLMFINCSEVLSETKLINTKPHGWCTPMDGAVLLVPGVE